MSLKSFTGRTKINDNFVSVARSNEFETFTVKRILITFNQPLTNYCERFLKVSFFEQ